ncbi:hypothetical protein [Aquimarina algicola]|uniref:Uncharacterized protein n=1 Tax=Aquimarina algicola TaxID=2589995 RepID=A0A504JH99_9FLAO|nr:hypothetical protein [Aquimarina algicola]TPN85830.1 hypothetical protein FHK87_11110 [Aquimarina algicola]
MRDNPISECVNRQFFKAIEVIREQYALHNLKSLSDHSIGHIIYGSNAYIVGQVREGKKHLPHSAMLNFSRYFDIPINFFYDEDFELELTIGENDVHSGRIYKKGIIVLVNEKIQQFIFNRKNDQNMNNPIVKNALSNLQESLIKELNDVTFVKVQNNVVKTIELALKAFEMSMQTLSTTSLQEVKPKNNDISDDKVALYKELLKANEAVLQAKDSENTTLKKYIASLERQLENSLLP